MKHLFKVTILTLAMLCCYTMISEAKVKKTRKARTEKRITKTPSLSSKEIGSETMNDSQKTTNEREYVDLGLPSGTLWATCNVGASSPEDYGDYFAWGETAPKSVYKYKWSAYKWCNGGKDNLTKYCTRSDYGRVDNQTELEPVDDAATVNWGKGWRMPSVDQIKELMDNCTSEWTSRCGVKGRLFTSKRNGASLFFPAAGYRDGLLDLDVGSAGYYWSHTLSAYFPGFAWCLYIFSRAANGSDIWDRSNGRSVRAVRVSQN